MTSPRPAAPMPAAVLWDMDGTLVDTEPYWFAAERDLVAEFGNEWSDDDAHAMVGFDLDDSADYLREHGGVDLDNDEIINYLLDEVIARVRHKLPWRPGARRLLAELGEAGVPCVLVTMSWRRLVDEVLDALPHDSFVASVAGDEVPDGKGKPHPTPYLLAAQALGVEPNDCVAIEDSPTGVKSALDAGCHVIGIPNVKPLEATPGLVRRRSLRDLDLAGVSRIYAAADDTPVSAKKTSKTKTQSNTKAKAGKDTPRHEHRRRRLLALLAVVLVVAGAGAWLLRDPGPPPRPPGSVAIDTWAPYWVLDDTLVGFDDKVNWMRDVSPFWFGAHGATDIRVDQYVPDDLARTFMTRVARSYADLVPSVRDEMPAGGMAAVIADPTTRTQHIDTLLTFVNELGADGLDLDYEQFAFADNSSTWEATRANWVVFIEELAGRLHAQGLTLTVSIPPVYDPEVSGSRGYWVYDHGTIAKYVDTIRIMAYDYSTAEPGPIAPLTWVQESVDGVSAAVDERYHDKLTLGVPVYGSNWVASTAGTCPASAEGRTSVTSQNVGDLIERRSATPVFDAVDLEWSFEYQLEVTEGAESCTQTRQVRWIDSEGVAARVEIARRAGWGGVSLWALGYDDPEAWDAFLNSTNVALPIEPAQ